MLTTPRVLLFDAAGGLAVRLEGQLRARGLAATRLDPVEALAPGLQAREGDVAVVLAGTDAAAGGDEALAAVLKRLVAEKVATVVCGGGEGLRHEAGPLVEWLAADADLNEVVGKIGTLARYMPLLKGFERELRHLQRLGEQLNRYFGELDQEMRLAGRLQHDFLPRELPHVTPFVFDAIYRPATWVSGDMYDAFRIDETHVGLFIADAMGHGVAAGLLTMFLRQALVPKRIAGGAYTLVRPAEALEILNTCLLRQKLPNAQFVTAVYGVLDTASRELTLARAGHPYPVLVRPDGALSEIRAVGSLLGLPDVPSEFEEVQVTLAPGDKVVFYTDGVEEAIALPHRDTDDAVEFTEQFRHWSGLSASEFVRAVGDYLDCREGSLHPADDITLLILQVLG